MPFLFAYFCFLSNFTLTELVCLQKIRLDFVPIKPSVSCCGQFEEFWSKHFITEHFLCRRLIKHPLCKGHYRGTLAAGFIPEMRPPVRLIFKTGHKRELLFFFSIYTFQEGGGKKILQLQKNSSICDASFAADLLYHRFQTQNPLSLTKHLNRAKQILLLVAAQ